MTSDGAHLPPELLHDVFSLLRGDETTLSSCILVSRHWYRSDRSERFRILHLRCRKELSDEGGDVFSRFWRGRPPTHLSHHVRDLNVWFGSDWSLRGQVTAYELDALISHFSHLQFLTLEGADLILATKDVKRWENPLSLRELRLNDIHFHMQDWTETSQEEIEQGNDMPTHCSLVQLFNMFGMIDALYMDDVWPPDRPGYDLESFSYSTYSWESAQRSAIWAEAARVSEDFNVLKLVTYTGAPNRKRSQEEALDLLSNAVALESVEHLEVDESIVITRDLLGQARNALRHLRLAINDHPLEFYESEAGSEFPFVSTSSRVCNAQCLYVTTVASP